MLLPLLLLHRVFRVYCCCCSYMGWLPMLVYMFSIQQKACLCVLTSSSSREILFTQRAVRVLRCTHLTFHGGCVHTIAEPLCLILCSSMVGKIR